MISERQEKLLNFLIKEYIITAEPVSSLALKKVSDLKVSAATIRNDLQELDEAGYIKQPHTSAGRVPTQKAYQHFSERVAKQIPAETEIFYCDFIFKEVELTKKQIDSQLKELENIFSLLNFQQMPGEKTFFEILNIIDSWHKKTRN